MKKRLPADSLFFIFSLMKKNIYLFSTLFVFCCAFLTSCHTDRQNATKAAYEYSYAMANYQIDQAEPFATEETKNTTLVKARQLVNAVDKAYIQSDTPAELEITNLEFTSDTSAIATYHKTTPIKDFSGTLELRKRNGVWLAHTPIPVVEQTPRKNIDDSRIKRFNPKQMPKMDATKIK